jgi:hypothetical protein
VEVYPHGEDTPAALAELAQEGANLDPVVRARCRQLAESLPDDPLAARARAALRRLELPGQEMNLTLPFLNDPAQSFHVSRLAGDVVVVYCWSSADSHCHRNCDALQHFWEDYGSKGLGLVMVNLDTTARQGQDAWQGLTLPAVQLYAPGGLAGAWARDHGVAEVPTVFLLGKDGRVITQVLGPDTLATELRKQFPEQSQGTKP